MPPLGAAAIRALDTAGVTAFVVGLGVDANNSKGLRAQNVDGPALLEATVDELCDRYGMLGGDAHRVMRAVQRAVAEAAAEAALAMAKASAEAALAMAKASAEAALAMAEAERRAAVTLTVYPPLRRGGPNNPVQVTLTPADFRLKYVLSGAPLQLHTRGRALVKEIMTLAEAVEETTRDPTARLHTTRSFGDDLEDLRGFKNNAAKALEVDTTRALACDAALALVLGPLEAVNDAESFFVSQRKGGALLQQLEIDGLVVGARGVSLLNSAKHTPSLEHVAEVIADAEKLRGVLGGSEMVTTSPPGARAQLNNLGLVLPVLSGSNFSAAVEAECLE